MLQLSNITRMNIFKKQINILRNSKRFYNEINKIKNSKLFSTQSYYDSDIEDDMLSANKIIEDIPESNFSMNDYLNHFELKNFNHIPYAPVGSYIGLTDNDMSKYFPEGLAGELKEEFEFSDTKKWMIRDSTKLVCRLIDNFEHYKNGNNNEILDKIIPSDNVEVPILTDNTKEWHDTVISVQYYGDEILNKQKKSLKASGSLSVDKPPDNLISNYIDRIKFLHKTSDDKIEIPETILLSGPRGVGKSVTLNQAVFYARKKGWLCVFIPNGWSHVQEGSYVEPAILTMEHANHFSIMSAEDENENKKDLLSNNAMEPFIEPLFDNVHVFDNHEKSTDVMRGLLSAHALQLRHILIRDLDILRKYDLYRSQFKNAYIRVSSISYGTEAVSFVKYRGMILKDNYVAKLDKNDEVLLENFDYLSFEPKTLEDLVILGVALHQLSGSLFLDLMEELKQVESIPILIAVDQYNCWEIPSAFSFNNKSISGKDLCVPHALSFLSMNKAENKNWKMKNGLCIATTSLKHSEGKKITYQNKMKSIPLSITVPSYNAMEFFSVVTHYTNNYLIPNQIKLEDILALRMFTGSNPRLMRVDLHSYLLPRVSEYFNEWEKKKADGTLTDLSVIELLRDLDNEGDNDNGDANQDDNENNRLGKVKSYDDDGDDEIVKEKKSKLYLK